MTLDFLQRNTTDTLWEKCLEKHNLYPPAQQGGPLIFLIMMKKIQSNTDDAVRYLIDGIQKMKLSDFDGENIDRAISLLRGAERRLRNAPAGVPRDFPTWVMRIFQTSSVTAFNDKFKLFTDILSLGRTFGTEMIPIPNAEELFRLAENTYTELLALDEWTGVTTKANQSHNGLIANFPKNNKTAVCWNCDGQGHSVNDCPKPANNQRIEAKRQAYKDQKKKEREGKNKNKKPPKKGEPKTVDPKWAPPADGASNKRVIDGKPRYWSRRWSKWCIDKNTLDGTPPAPSAALVDTRVPPRTIRFEDEGSASAQERQARNTALANTAHIINDALRGLSQQFE